MSLNAAGALDWVASLVRSGRCRTDCTDGVKKTGVFRSCVPACSLMMGGTLSLEVNKHPSRCVLRLDVY